MALSNNNEQFDALPLHDAILKELRLNWQERTCVAPLGVVVDHQQDAMPRILVWNGVRETHVPHHDAWGPSACINVAHFEPPDLYVVEMQSGDRIIVTAESFIFVVPPV